MLPEYEDLAKRYKRIAGLLRLATLNLELATDALDDTEQAAGEAYQFLNDARENCKEWKKEVIQEVIRD